MLYTVDSIPLPYAVYRIPYADPGSVFGIWCGLGWFLDAFDEFVGAGS